MLVVVDVGAEVVVVVAAPEEAPVVVVDGELLEADPQPTRAIADASTTPTTEDLFMECRLAISPDDLLNGARCRRAGARAGGILAEHAWNQRF